MPRDHARVSTWPRTALRNRFAALVATLIIASVAPSRVAVAQVAAAPAMSAAEHVAAGDRDYQGHASTAAAAHYEAALRLEPRRYDALWKASRSTIDMGEASTGDRQKQLYQHGEALARRAVAADPQDAEGHFALARALGRIALSLGSRERVKYATEIRAEALRALELNPAHAGALDVMGMWNAEVMRLNGIARMIAKNFLGGQVFGTASWAEAQRYLEEAVRVDPAGVVHRLNLGLVYRDVGKNAKAREMLEAAVRAREIEPNDARYKAEAAAALKKL
jgi:tetratricopeptide (TPR) repeat protein